MYSDTRNQTRFNTFSIFKHNKSDYSPLFYILFPVENYIKIFLICYFGVWCTQQWNGITRNTLLSERKKNVRWKILYKKLWMSTRSQVACFNEIFLPYFIIITIFNLIFFLHQIHNGHSNCMQIFQRPLTS